MDSKLKTDMETDKAPQESQSTNLPAPRVTVEIDENQIALVSLNRADKYNALDMAMFHAIANTAKNLSKNKQVRVVIVRGHGKNFCTGLDVKSVFQDKTNFLKLLFKWWPSRANLAQRVSTAWRDVSVPVIFALHGKCWGGGLQIAMGGDFRIAGPDIDMSILEARWGLIPDMGGTLAFKELLRADQLKELAMTGRMVYADEALKLGLVTEIHQQPLERAYQLAEQLLQSSPDALAAAKKLYNQSWWSSAGSALFREFYYQIKVILGKNQSIAIKRAQAKSPEQKPDYIDRSFD
ncbi:crotonase/enoyl-CoA hydratase family protein [Endozoicomonas sp. G2_1]|uniref:crotonase/enoyl-CoA hydratase family protein n=1 Tax=Endozoicomonas sp. G2_1 TaxID=2821091 RepID=UPI001ADBCEAF|nr:crotonase/enoyl-CoA hydratase family protein [Endozoicomonas sp. G2_1]MBO9491455.1 crotonase/enoyl-CoA hydratase family protein [Endozoicomonas sp. G2_1]